MNKCIVCGEKTINGVTNKLCSWCYKVWEQTEVAPEDLKEFLCGLNPYFYSRLLPKDKKVYVNMLSKKYGKYPPVHLVPKVVTYRLPQKHSLNSALFHAYDKHVAKSGKIMTLDSFEKNIVRSLFSMKHKPNEVLVVDDSTDIDYSDTQYGGYVEFRKGGFEEHIKENAGYNGVFFDCGRTFSKYMNVVNKIFTTKRFLARKALVFLGFILRRDKLGLRDLRRYVDIAVDRTGFWHLYIPELTKKHEGLSKVKNMYSLGILIKR